MFLLNYLTRPAARCERQAQQPALCGGQRHRRTNAVGVAFEEELRGLSDAAIHGDWAKLKVLQHRQQRPLAPSR